MPFSFSRYCVSVQKRCVLPDWNFSRYHKDEISIDSDAIKVVRDGETLGLFDNIYLQAIATPGHDKSCLSYRVGNMLFTGDSYIPGIKVIASFPHSNKPDALLWEARLSEMSKTHDIYPGHGPITISTTGEIIHQVNNC